MKNFNDYKTKLPWLISPLCPSRKTFLSSKEYVEYEEVMYPKLLEEYRSAKQAYKEDEARLIEQFKEDLYKDLGISDHPKRHKLFQKAWENDHSYGFEAVYNEALDLVELIK